MPFSTLLSYLKLFIRLLSVEMEEKINIYTTTNS